MIKTETIESGKRTLIRTFSDAGVMIKNNKTKKIFIDAADPQGTKNTYVETSEEVPNHEMTKKELKAELKRTKEELKAEKEKKK